MSRLKKRRIAHRKEAELEVTPFMNMMMLLVCALLASVVFTKITVIDLDFPAGNGSGDVDSDLVHLEVIVRNDQLVVADGRGGAIKTLPLVDGAQDLKGLSLVMRELKRRMPEKRDIVILLESDTNYQTLVSVMDRVRSYSTVVAMEVVEAELFPVISLGDPPAKAT
ncbi:MAG TPA: biopolymer transporter ExbD [Pseudomonadales bacterium]|jgi:biopolymer transport protein ExbD|nr:biopolymer transporter ExbD [Pseudomonadales bacterium]